MDVVHLLLSLALRLSSWRRGRESEVASRAAAPHGVEKDTVAKKLSEPRHDARWFAVLGSELREGDVVLVAADEMIPADGEVIEGVAVVDESAVTGQAAPAIREGGGDFSVVIGGTRVLSGWIVVRIAGE